MVTQPGAVTNPDTEREEYEAAWAALGVKAPPRGIDLPDSDGEPIENWLHWLQMTLLLISLRRAWRDRDDYFAGGNMFLYFNAEQARTRDIRGPDVFVVTDVPGHPRRSWVVWEERKAPDLIIEINSPTTRHIDHGIKKRIYQDEVRVPMYVLYDMDRDELEGFRLVGGVYEPVPLDDQGRLSCDVLGLLLMRWDGKFAGGHRRWLRWVTPDGTMLTTGDEDADAAEARVDAAEARLDAAAAELDAVRHRAEVAERRLRELEARLAGHEPPDGNAST